MDGMHDLGGKQGFGRVRYSLKAQTFHEPWEKRVNALYSLAVKLGIFNMDEYRHAIERMEPRHYLSASYYERSLTSLATLCVEKGIVTREELERRAQGQFPLSSPSAPGRGNVDGRQRLQPGDRVRVRADYVPGHVRMPGYIRGKTGVVVIGYDSGKVQKDAIRSGEMAGAITQSPVGIGYETVKAALAAIKGEKLPATIDSGFAWYDKTNIDAPEIAAVLYD